jgi:hypothetical protein
MRAIIPVPPHDFAFGSTCSRCPGLIQTDQGPCKRVYRTMPRRRPRPYSVEVSSSSATLGTGFTVGLSGEPGAPLEVLSSLSQR